MMESVLALGTAITVVSGGLNGAFILPMRMVNRWQWENTWLVFGIFGLVLLPFALALLTVPHLFSVYAAVPSESLMIVLLLGVAWGIGSLLFGLGISALGMSLGYSIIMGTSTICGTLVPAAFLNSISFSTFRGISLLACLALIIASLVLFTRAGRKRDEDQTGSPPQYQILTRTNFSRGLLLGIGSGVLSACFNIGFALAEVIPSTARQYGASSSVATLSVWALIMGAGFIPSLIYCLWRLRQNHSFVHFKGAYRNWWYALEMGILWVAGVALYGVGASQIGNAGAAIGWPILMSMTILTANIIGISFGEWKGSWKKVKYSLISGLSLLVLAVILAGVSGAH